MDLIGVLPTQTMNSIPVSDLFSYNELIAPRGAMFCPCKKYRYRLWRRWSEEKPAIMFIGLNPSVADGTDDDPTMRRVIRFARDWGYGMVYMTNLFCGVATKYRELDHSKEVVGLNNYWLQETAALSDKVVFAWGASNTRGRDQEVIAMFPNAFTLQLNQDGSPMHPLFVPAAKTLIKFS